MTTSGQTGTTGRVKVEDVRILDFEEAIRLVKAFRETDLSTAYIADKFGDAIKMIHDPTMGPPSFKVRKLLTLLPDNHSLVVITRDSLDLYVTRKNPIFVGIEIRVASPLSRLQVAQPLTSSGEHGRSAAMLPTGSYRSLHQHSCVGSMNL